jgi:phage tail sheath protein FI
MARTDTTRGIFKAAAGLDAKIRSHSALDRLLTEEAQEKLVHQGVNGLRQMRGAGPVIWGARTLRNEGADQYIPCKRLHMHIRDSITASLSQAVFYANTTSLWAGVQLAAKSFLHDLFLEGAFAGQTPETSYFAKCDASTVTPIQRDEGILCLQLGFAPLRPNDFVTLQIEAQTALNAQPEPQF